MVRRSKAQWRALIEAQRTRGLSAAEFCRQHALNDKYFSLQKRRLGKSTGGFVKVEPLASNPVKSASNGIKLRVIEVEC